MYRPSIVFVTAWVVLGGTASVRGQELTEAGRKQVQAVLAEKASRTPTQRKLATSLLYAAREVAGTPMVQGLAPLRRVADRAGVDAKGMVVVELRAEVTDTLLLRIQGVGGEVLRALPAFEAVRARLPIRAVEEIAALREVRTIEPRQAFLLNTGSQTSQGDTAHAAAAARALLGVDGTGVKVGVLSDGVDSLAARQATGDLPPTCGSGACITVLPGEAGSGDEGTAMLEIVHDLAPGAQLFFATAASGGSSFAANIRTLRNTYGCDVIVDDITYLDEGAFQDGEIAQAVNTVRASGALFFSAAGNSGRLSAGTSGTWEGDFVDSGTAISPVTDVYGEPLPLQSFNGLTGGSAANADALVADSGPISLKWSDPLTAAADDYDLLLLDSSLSVVVDASLDDQSVTAAPLEIMGAGFNGEKVVVVKWSGVARALRLDTNRGRLQLATTGATYGHNAGEATLSVAAVAASSAGGGAFTGGSANPVESYSSDGPRRIFFNPDGSPITPGNLLFATNGGRLLAKPDITAADCVTTTTPGFIPFCGTSAAAPHAAAIAALLLSTSPAPTADAVGAAMVATALDVTPAGRDDDSGAGIAMANGPGAVADLSLTMTGPDHVLPGGDVVYTITVRHNGLASASSVQVADPTPAGLTFVSNAGDCVTAFPCALGTLTTGETRTITATFNAPPGYTGPSPFANIATVSSATPDPLSSNDSASVSVRFGSAADIAVTKTGPDFATLGVDFAYTIVVTNAGPDAADNVQVADPAPAGVVFVSNAGACATAFPCALGTLAAGASRTISASFNVPVGYAGPITFTNLATVSSTTNDPVPVNNQASASVRAGAQADLTITLGGPAFATRAADVHYTIVVTNAGPDTATAVQVALPTPPGLSFVSNIGACTTAFPCSLGSLTSGSARSISVTFHVPAGYDSNVPIVSTATVSSTTGDPVPANDSATVTSRFGAFYALDPCRLVDTRTPAQAPALQPNEERTFVLAGSCGLPSGVVAVSVNLTVTAPAAAGNLRLYPADVVAPLVSSLNFSAGQTRANNAVVATAADGSVALTVKNGSSGSAHVVLDVNGYFE